MKVNVSDSVSAPDRFSMQIGKCRLIIKNNLKEMTVLSGWRGRGLAS